MKKTTFAIAAIAVIVLAAASSIAAVDLFHDHQSKRFHTAWKDVYGNAPDQIRAVDKIVVARLIGKSPGRVAVSSDPSDVVPFELNHFEVEQGIKGVNVGDTITVERVGGEVGGQRVILDADGGEYKEGERYLLFLNRQPESTYYYVVNDEGRYALNGQDHLIPVGDGAVANELAGMTVGDFGRLAREAQRGAKIQ